MSRASKNSSNSKSSIHIHINPRNRGKFTADTKAHGENVQERTAQVLKPGSKASAATNKQANFAKNAAKWKKGK